MYDSSHHSTLEGIAYEKYLQKQNDLQGVVLKYVFEHPYEPLDLYRLSARYRSDSCLIGLVLTQLRQWEYIAVDMQGNVTITGRGVDRLRRLEGWN
jgi:hypothetical protein